MRELNFFSKKGEGEASNHYKKDGEIIQNRSKWSGGLLSSCCVGKTEGGEICGWVCLEVS
jgi:hypothetical protein